MRIFMGLTEISGYYSNLKNGFDELGIKVSFIDLSHHPYDYSDEQNDFFSRTFRAISIKQEQLVNANWFFKGFWRLAHRILRLFLFFWAMSQFDTFIFAYKTSFLPRHYDLVLMKLLRKKIIYVFHGSDSRPPYIDGAIMSEASQRSIQDCLELTKQQKKQIKRIERYADIIINHPPAAHFHQKPFIMWFAVGIPFLPELSSADMPERAKTKKIRILHSPSHVEAKGSLIIRDTIRRLKVKGHSIEFIEISGKPNAIVLEEIASCDFVIDQLYSDTPMAGFATEAAAFAKPAVVGGYISSADLFMPEEQLPPSAFCRPEQLEQTIERLILDKDYRLRLGRAAQVYVTTKWHPEEVAKRYMKLIAGEIPDSWWLVPEKIKYIRGWGLPEDKTKKIVKAMIQKDPEAALQLEDKSKLEKLFVDFVNNGK